MKSQNFKTFVAKAKKVFNSRNSVAVLDNVLLQNGFAIVSDSKTFYKCKIEALDETINALIDFKDFSKLLEKLKDSEINFETTETVIKIKTSKGNFTFPVSDPKDFPVIHYGINAIDYITPSDTATIKKALPFASDDEIRPVLCQILIEPETIVSTDTHILFFKDRDSIKSAFTDSYKMLKTIPALLEANKSYTVLRSASTKGIDYATKKESEIPGKYLSIKNETEEIIFMEESGMYPNYKVVIPSKLNQTTTLNLLKKELQEVLEMCELAQNKGSQLTKITIDAELETFQISCQDIDSNKSYMAGIKADIEGKSLEIGFKNSFVQKALKAIDGNELTFTFSDPTRATILNDQLLIMPHEL